MIAPERLTMRYASRVAHRTSLTTGGTATCTTSLLLGEGRRARARRLSPARPGTEPRIREVVTVDAEGRTSVPGVWAAGTAAGVSVHTIVTAGDGARVTINIISGQKGQRHVDHDVLPPRPEAST